MRLRYAIIVATATLLVSSTTRSGHEPPVYPSYYPHEIEIATIAPERASELIRAGRLHAYIGDAPPIAAAPRDTIGTVASLGSFVVVRLNPASAHAKDETSACAVGRAILRDMATRGGELIAHPYPVTPYHGDYLYHVDRAEAARQRVFGGDPPALPGELKVRAAGALARGLVRPGWLTTGPQWDATVEEVSIVHLVAEATVVLNGWLGPRWVRSGWFHAYRLLADSIEPVHRRQIDAGVERLRAASYDGTVERINLERDTVTLLMSGCRAMVAGYRVKREYFNAAYSGGTENLSFDALEGLHSPMFLRTVKLKDFPWNGWLQLGVEARAASAWNPIGGFTDPFGRLMWFAIADPAAIPSPYEATWTLNRISQVEASPR